MRRIAAASAKMSGDEYQSGDGTHKGGDLLRSARHWRLREAKIQSAVRYCKQPGIANGTEERHDPRIIQAEILIVRMHLYPPETGIRNLLEMRGVVPVGRMDGAELYQTLRRLLSELTVADGLSTVKNHPELGRLSRNGAHYGPGNTRLVQVGKLRRESAVPDREQTASQLLDHHIHGARGKLVGKIVRMKIYYSTVHEITSRHSPKTQWHLPSPGR